MSHFKARNSNYPSFDRLSSDFPNGYKMHGAYEQFQLSGEFELVCLAASKLDSISSASVAQQGWLFFTCISPLCPTRARLLTMSFFAGYCYGRPTTFFCKITVQRSNIV